MQFTTVTFFFALVAMLSMALNTVARPVLLERTVYNPRIISPAAGDEFKAGETITVRWDTSELPEGNENVGMIVLGHLTKGSENLDVEHPLASDFLLTDGCHDVTFPSDLKTRETYILDLFGDSGNISEKFTIHARQ